MPALKEPGRRLAVAAEAKSLGRGGIVRAARASGISISTVQRGLRELKAPGRRRDPEQVRRTGGGRKRLTDADSRLLSDLESLVEPVVRGDSDSPLRWTTKSRRTLAYALCAMGHTASHVTIGTLLRQARHSLQANQKTRGCGQHPDRYTRFEFIYGEVGRHQAEGRPVISVDTRKKELVGDFKNGGRDWRASGKPRRVRVHDFLIPRKGKAISYGI